jgi:hypothetical protein
MSLRCGRRSVFALCALSALVSGIEARAEARLVITDVHVVDVRRGRVSGITDITVAGNRIASINRVSARERTAGAVLEGRGGYVIPGLWDMHAHVNFPRYAERWILPSLLSAGVTGVRDMAGDCWAPGCKESIAFMRDLQARLAAGEIAGPRMLAISSALIHGQRRRESGTPPLWAPHIAQEAGALVHELRRRGVDFLKPYDTLSREAYFELVREARAAGLTVSGHVPLAVTTTEALRAGQVTIEHAKHPLLDCSAYSGTFHEIFAAWSSGASERIYRNWAAEGEDNLGGYYSPILAGYDERLCSRVIASMARAHVIYVPTLITRRFEARANDASYLADPRLAAVPAALRGVWQADAGRLAARFRDVPGEAAAYDAFYRRSLSLVHEAWRAGVPVLVGTDSPDSYCFPEGAIHDEMLELHTAGLPNAAILRAATLGAAEFLGRTADFGTVGVDKLADLVLLATNPLENLAAARDPQAVVLDGRVFDHSALREMRSAAAAFARTAD